MHEPVKVTRNEGILEIVLDHPKVNAIGLEVSQKLGAAFVELRDDPDLSVGIITGAGERIFSAGWDLKAVNSGEMQTDNWWDDDYGPGGFAGLTELWDLNKPVIAALNGVVIGGGFELAMACDLLVAAEHVTFSLPELPLGLIPDAGAIQRLARRLPYNKAMEMYLLGQKMPASEAAAYGLVNAVVPASQVMETCQGLGQAVDPGCAVGAAVGQGDPACHRGRHDPAGVSDHARRRSSQLPGAAQVGRCRRRHGGLSGETKTGIQGALVRLSNPLTSQAKIIVNPARQAIDMSSDFVGVDPHSIRRITCLGAGPIGAGWAA